MKARIELSKIVLVLGSIAFGCVLTMILWKGVGLAPGEVLGALLGLVSLLIGGVAYYESQLTARLLGDIQSTLDAQGKPLEQLFQTHTAFMQSQLNRKAGGGEIWVPPSGSWGP